eukprot:CAMPEP_0195281174 /NCGR_PEP_ID=MMETSP0707-20130614/599_1 /TAXON_ID=33640 /ORGANISM="Asterionellopsis glacialis, Strain CCMP134" /LENGTH=387 /DNA_ID=CAMNT_0040340033 /DNA_START=8 /DNA_END=1171 /DNA_ORIENTATION=-
MKYSLSFVLLLIFQSMALALSTKAPPPTSTFNKGATAAGPASPSTNPPKFTKNEIEEHNYVWKVMNNACFGKWSGSMKVYKVNDRTHQLIPDTTKNNEKLNFRLWARQTRNNNIQNNNRQPFFNSNKNNFGTWTVWNLMTKGDEVNVPLMRLPFAAPSQLKIGFEPGCVLRTPKAFKDAPRAVFELGFWDPQGDGMRRTVVVEYSVEKQMKLKDITIVQQKSVPQKVPFVGNTTVAQDIETLPEVPPSQVTDDILLLSDGEENNAEPIRMERVDLSTMTRTITKKGKFTTKDKALALQVLESVLSSKQNSKDNHNLVHVLPNELCTSVPKQLQGGLDDPSTTTKSLVFAHSWSSSRHGPLLQVLHVEYDSTTSSAIAATMFSYHRGR